MGEIIELVCCQFYTFPGKIMSKDRNLLAICWLTFPMVITLCGRSSVLYIVYNLGRFPTVLFPLQKNILSPLPSE